MPSPIQRRTRSSPEPPPANDDSTAGGERAHAGWVALGLFAATLALAALLTHDRVFMAGNDASRFAHIQSLVEHGRASVDGSKYAWTPDRVILDGRAYSNKPPLLALLGAALFAALHGALGWNFAEHEARTVYGLTLLLVGGSLALLVPLFHRALRLLPGTDPLTRAAATLALAMGTILTSFSGTLNGHPVAALGLFAAFAAALVGRGLTAGACIAFATCIDIVPGLLFVPAIASIALDRGGPRGLRRMLSAGAVGALVFFAANLATVGHPLPPKLVPGAVDLSSRVGASVAGVLLPTRWSYPLECLLGWHGFFSISPVLLFGLAGLALAARGGVLLTRRSMALLCAAVAAVILFHALVAGSFGGWSYGFRYLIPLAPILLFFAPLALRGWARWAFAPVLAVSIALGLLGAYHPWPPVDEQVPDAPRSPASLVTNPVGGNLAAWLAEVRPGSAAAGRAGARFISPDPGERAEYLALFFRSKGDRRMQREILRGAAAR